MKLNDVSKTVKEAIKEQFDYTFDFDFLDVVADLVERSEYSVEYEDVLSAVDEGLIYNYDQWIVAQYYAGSPSDLNWDEVFEQLVEDIIQINEKISESDDSEEEDD